jgi:hypothetical protein
LPQRLSPRGTPRSSSEGTRCSLALAVYLDGLF